MGTALHIGPDDLFAPGPSTEPPAPASSFGLDDSPWDTPAVPPLRARHAWPDEADPDGEGATRDEPEEPRFVPLTPAELGGELAALDEPPPNWPNA